MYKSLQVVSNGSIPHVEAAMLLTPGASFEFYVTLIWAAGGVQYMTRKTLNRYNSTLLQVKIFFYHICLKKHLVICLIRYFGVKNGVFNVCLVKNCGKPPIFAPFLYFSGSLGAYMPLLAPSTLVPCPGPPLARSWHTKQFLNCAHFLQLFLSEGMKLLTTVVA